MSTGKHYFIERTENGTSCRARRTLEACERGIVDPG